MTIIDRIRKALNSDHCMDDDTLDKLLIVAYYLGREEASRQVSDQYSALIREQKERADESRYHIFAHRIIGNQNYIYSPDYAGDFSATFGTDETAL